MFRNVMTSRYVVLRRVHYLDCLFKLAQTGSKYQTGCRFPCRYLWEDLVLKAAHIEKISEFLPI